MHFRRKKESLFTAADYGLDHVEVWPENWQPWKLWLEMSGQWIRAGMTGVQVAMNYGPVMQRMERMRLCDEDWEALFADFRSMEGAALEQMSDNDK